MNNPNPAPVQQQWFSGGQIRLDEISVYNWGSFHGLHTARVDPQGTLITGDNGAGKSTLVDGLMALMLPPGKSMFNVAAAQGDRTDRSLMSYVRGSYGTTHDGNQTQTLNKRTGAVVTALRAHHRADDDSEITLAALFWITQPSNALADLKRIYFVARRDLGLEEILEVFGEGNARALKLRLREDPLVGVFDDRFGEYQESWRRLLHIENRNAPALLARALGLKKIDDLTVLIRDLVLEPSNVRHDARKAVAEFDDLVSTHNQLLDARRQRDALVPLPEIHQSIRSAEQALRALTEQQSGLPIYFGEQCRRLWTIRLESLQAAFAQTERELARVEAEIERALRQVEQRHADYLRAGGERIENLTRELDDARKTLATTSVEASRYQELIRRTGLDPTLAHDVFNANQQRIETMLSNADEDKRTAQDELIDAGAGYSERQRQQRELREEIAEISERPDSNIDIRFQRLRDEMVEALGFRHDELMFIGELIDVSAQHRAWQGAIERALGGLRQTLVVPTGNFSVVTRWLNERHTGLHVRVQVAGEARRSPAVFKENGYLRKLEWRQHPYRDWLKHHLARFDLHCVASTSELDQTAFSVTQQGLIHFDQGRFEKKDQHPIDDRRHWQLGFSNRERLALLQRDLQGLDSELQNSLTSVTAARQRVDEVERHAKSLEQLAAVQWHSVDAPHWQARVESLTADLDRLQRAEDQLATAKHLWEEAKQALSALQLSKEQQIEQKGKLGSDLKSADDARSKAEATAEGELGEQCRAALEARVGELTEARLDDAAQLQAKHLADLERVWRTANSRKAANGNRAVAIMASFRRDWPVVGADWGSDLDSVDDYLQHLDQLEVEGLPALVEQFKERLNRHTTQSLARIRSGLDSEREDIGERIETINGVLARTEFRQGTYLRLRARSEQFPHVQTFNQRLTRVLGEAGSDDHEARFANLKEVIDILDKATNPSSAHTLESLRLLDPRYQLSFFAEELNAATDEIQDVLVSSSGKSGGEKEAFAGTVVAASLAYVLTPDGSDRPVFSTVFLDEAFSNTAEAVSRRVLRVFRALEIHVNLITPYKNLNLARESARSLLIAERDAQTHESRLCEVTWEEIDRRFEARRRDAVKEQMREYDVQLEPLDTHAEI